MTELVGPRDSYTGLPWALRRKHRPPEHHKAPGQLGTIMMNKYKLYYERQRQNDSFHVDRGISEELKAVRSRLGGWLDCHTGTR